MPCCSFFLPPVQLSQQQHHQLVRQRLRLPQRPITTTTVAAAFCRKLRFRSSFSSSNQVRFRLSCIRLSWTYHHLSSSSSHLLLHRFLLFSLFTALRIFFSFDDIQLQDFLNSMNEYEPLDYDVPNEPSSLLVFTNDSNYMSPHFSPNNKRSTLSPFDNSSPSSMASGADENNNMILGTPYLHL